ncbi:MAG TPA: hypothetical protein VNI54_10470 [Thermoanaerobaculia bacterium]|nr:hypothetical protein [Thermoanaerobaculia bacterium]
MGVAALVGATALAVSLGDRELFVPPPDAVAEGFVREVITGRYSRAQEYLSEPRPEKELRALRETLGHDPTEVEAEVISRTDEEALVNVRTTEAAVALALEFEGEWKIR